MYPCTTLVRHTDDRDRYVRYQKQEIKKNIFVNQEYLFPLGSHIKQKRNLLCNDIQCYLKKSGNK